MKFIKYAFSFFILVLLQCNLAAQDAAKEDVTLLKRFVGGSLSYDRDDGVIGARGFTAAPVEFFNFQSFVGRQVGKNIQLGLTAGYAYQNAQEFDFFVETRNTHEVNLGIFVRNQLISKGNFTFLFESTAIGSYQFGRFLEFTTTTPGGGAVFEENSFGGPYGFTLSLSPRVSYDFSRFRFLATFGRAGFTVVGTATDDSGLILSRSGSRIFVSALSRFVGLTAEYKF